jgi:hypothetical protein
MRGESIAMTMRPPHRYVPVQSMQTSYSIAHKQCSLDVSKWHQRSLGIILQHALSPGPSTHAH